MERIFTHSHPAIEPMDEAVMERLHLDHVHHGGQFRPDAAHPAFHMSVEGVKRGDWRNAKRGIATATQG